MFQRRSLRQALLHVGLTEVAPLKFSVPTSHPEVQWRVDFEALGGGRQGVSALVVFRHLRAHAFALDCLSTLTEPRWAAFVAERPEVFPGLIFPAAELVPNDPRFRWHLAWHRELTPSETSGVLTSVVHDHVLPYVSTIRNDGEYFQLLSSGAGPFSWVWGQPLLRAAEIVYFGTRASLSLRALQDMLQHLTARMATQLTMITPEEYVRRTFVAAA